MVFLMQLMMIGTWSEPDGVMFNGEMIVEGDPNKDEINTDEPNIAEVGLSCAGELIGLVGDIDSEGTPPSKGGRLRSLRECLGSW